MEVSAFSNGSRKDDTCSIDCLPSVCKVNPSSNLLDEHRRQTVRPQLLVHAEKVNLAHLHDCIMHAYNSRNSSDAGEESSSLFTANTDVPVFDVTWRGQRPSEEVFGVVESSDNAQLIK